MEFKWNNIPVQIQMLPPQGWAMKQAWTIQPFSGKQKAYMEVAFSLGVKKRNEKVNAKQLAKQMEEELESGTTKHLFDSNELLSAKQIANYFGLKARWMRDQQPECFNDLNSATCSAIDGQHKTSEGEEEKENAEDPMFFSVEDEMVELIEETGIIEGTTTTTDAPPIAPASFLTQHKHHHEHKEHDEIIFKWTLFLVQSLLHIWNFWL